MKLLVVTHSFPPAYADGGPVQSCGDLVKALVQEGVDVRVVTTNRNGNQCLALPVNVDIDWHGALVRYFPVRSPWWYGFAPTGFRHLSHAVREADIVHAMAVFSFLPDCAAWRALLARRPYVISPRGNLSPVSLRKGGFKKRLYHLTVTRTVLNHAGVVHCMTPMDSAWARAFGSCSRIVQVPNGVDFRLFEEPSDEDFFSDLPFLRGKQLVMFLGRIDPIKGLDMLLYAWAEAASSLPGAALVVVGPDPKGYRRDLVELAERLGVSSSVHFVGERAESRKRSALAAATLFVMPSYTENFGLAVAEAMASGLAVIASDRCGIVSSLRHGQDLWVVPCDRHAWSGALRVLLGNARLRGRLGEQGRRAARENFDLRAVTRRMLGLYEGVLGRSARGKSLQHSV